MANPLEADPGRTDVYLRAGGDVQIRNLSADREIRTSDLDFILYLMAPRETCLALDFWQDPQYAETLGDYCEASVLRVVPDQAQETLAPGESFEGSLVSLADTSGFLYSVDTDGDETVSTWGDVPVADAELVTDSLSQGVVVASRALGVEPNGVVPSCVDSSAVVRANLWSESQTVNICSP